MHILFDATYECPICKEKWNVEIDMDQLTKHSDANSKCPVCQREYEPANDETFRAAYEEMYGQPLED